jgi:hypothetical protein
VSSYKLAELHKALSLAAESMSHRGGAGVEQNYRVYLRKERGKVRACPGINLSSV